MIVFKHTIDIDKIERVEYPAKWGNEVVGLDKNISFYEIVEGERPVYNPNQFTLAENIELTDTMGENKLKLANVIYSLIEKNEAQIINYLNTELGNHLDNQHPTWERVKYHVEANSMRWDIGLENFTVEQQARYDYIIAINIWVNECRTLRDDYEQIYKAEGTLPTVNFPPKPLIDG